MKKQTPMIVKKSVKHVFTPDETANLNTEFRQAYANLKAVESEFDNVKAVWKAKTTEAESRMETLNATLQAGFEWRPTDCAVIFRPKDKKKDYHLLDGDALVIPPVLIEDMTQNDFEQDLIQAEAAFENRAALKLWDSPTAVGYLLVGRLANKWYSALRGNVGTLKIEEHLDSEQRAYKVRADAVNEAAKRANKWLKTNLKESAKGFEDGIAKVVNAEAEKVE